MTAAWSPEQLARIGEAEELELAPRRRDGTLRRWVTIWVVSAGGHVYVRTWYRREHGWFAHAVRSGRARIAVPGLETDVAVEDVSRTRTDLRADVDAAYRGKYRRHGDSSVGPMVGDDAADTTLRLTREVNPSAPSSPLREDPGANDPHEGAL